jgi:hypothetical protein
MLGRELEALMRRVVSESGDPKIEQARTLEEGSDSPKLGLRVTFADRSEVFCQFVQAIPANGRAAHPDYQLPEGML